MRKFLASVALATAVGGAALLSFVFAASANTYSLVGDFNGIAVNVGITTSNVVDAFGGYDVVGVTGSVGGASVTGLDTFNGPPAPYTDTTHFGNLFLTYDNVFYTSTQHLDGDGLSVALSNGWYANISANTGGYTGPSNTLYGYFLIEGYSGGPYCSVCQAQTETTSIAETPLPSAWTMLLAGFIGFGFLAYRGTKKSTALAAA